MIYLVWKLTQFLAMEMLSSVLGEFIGVGMFALIVVFQQEIRKFLLMIGSTNFGRRRNFLKQLKFMRDTTEESLDSDADLHEGDHWVYRNCSKIMKPNSKYYPKHDMNFLFLILIRFARFLQDKDYIFFLHVHNLPSENMSILPIF